VDLLNVSLLTPNGAVPPSHYWESNAAISRNRECCRAARCAITVGSKYGNAELGSYVTHAS
jgi:hypothetical protein